MQRSDVTIEVQKFTMPATVTCLSFDIWNTLIRGNKEFTRPRLALIFKLLGYPEVDIEDLREAYLESSHFFDHLSEQTGLDFGIAPRIERMTSTLDLSVVLPGAEALRSIQRQVGVLRLESRYMASLTEPDLIETLKLLRASGYRLGLLSNTGMDDHDVMEPTLKKLGIWELCDVMLFSSKNGLAKPNPTLFRQMAGEFEVVSSAVLHIGDNVNADYRAWEAGLESVVYAPKGNNEYPSIASMKELLA